VEIVLSLFLSFIVPPQQISCPDDGFNIERVFTFEILHIWHVCIIKVIPPPPVRRANANTTATGVKYAFDFFTIDKCKNK
jgi:hypothetical protein